MIKINRQRASLLLLELLIILVLFNPIADLFPSYAQVIVFVLWIVSTIKDKVMWKNALRLSWISLVILIFCAARCIFAGQLNLNYYSSFQVAIARYQMLIFPILFAYVMRRTKHEKNELFAVAIASIVGTIMVSLFYIFFVDPQAIRNTQRPEPLFGVGDFSLMYAIAMLMGPLIILTIERKKQNKPINLIAISIILMAICLILCNLVTSVVVMVASIAVALIVRYRSRTFSIIAVIISVLLLLMKSLIAQLLHGVANSRIFYWSTSNKIEAIANIIDGNFANIDTISRRIMLATISLESFAKNPLLGIDWKEYTSSSIGCHMQWADDLGRFGIIGCAVIIYNYIKIAKETIMQQTTRIAKDSMIAVWIIFVILGFLNPCISSANMAIMFIVVPTFSGMVDVVSKENRKYLLLVNQYNSDNIGDKFLSRTFAKKLTSYGYEVKTCGFAQIGEQKIDYECKRKNNIKKVLKNKAPNYIKYLVKYLPRLEKATSKIDTTNCEAMIIGGGQLFKHNTVFIHCLKYWLKWAKRNKIPVHIFGVGVDSDLSKHEIKIYRSLINIPKSINCRDSSSEQLFRNKLGCTRVEVSPDIAFLAKPPKSKKRNMVTVMPYNYDKAVRAFNFNRTRNDYYEEILISIKDTKAKEVTLSATTTDDAEECYKIKQFLELNGIKVRLTRIYEPDELLELSSRSSLMVTGRMHAMIACKICETEVAPLIVSDKIKQFRKEYMGKKDLSNILEKTNNGFKKLMIAIREQS